MNHPRDSIERHCREVIRQCLNIAEEKGDHYIAIHKDDDTECVVLISMLHTQPILSIIVADKLVIDAENEDSVYRMANDMNRESLTGWHSVKIENTGIIYMYRQCLWMSEQLTREYLMDLLCTCIAAYKAGKESLFGWRQPEI